MTIQQTLLVFSGCGRVALSGLAASGAVLSDVPGTTALRGVERGTTGCVVQDGSTLHGLIERRNHWGLPGIARESQ